MIETEDVVLLRRLVEHGRKHGALLNADNEAWGAIERLREENARAIEAAWREGWSTGYRSGMTDGGSDSCWCDEAGDWEKSNARAALNQQ